MLYFFVCCMQFVHHIIRVANRIFLLSFADCFLVQEKSGKAFGNTSRISETWHISLGTHRKKCTFQYFLAEADSSFGKQAEEGGRRHTFFCLCEFIRRATFEMFWYLAGKSHLTDFIDMSLFKRYQKKPNATFMLCLEEKKKSQVVSKCFILQKETQNLMIFGSKIEIFGGIFQHFDCKKIIKKSFTNIEGFTTKLCIIHFEAKALLLLMNFSWVAKQASRPRRLW